MMTIEELKAEANAHGYNLIPQKKQEKFIPCTCGCNRREHWIRWVDGGTETTLKCCKCGKSASGMSEAEAKRNWNEMIRGELKESEDNR